MWNRSPVQVQCMRQGPQGWCTGMTLRDRMEREVGVGFRMRNTCTPMADSCQCMAKTHSVQFSSVTQSCPILCDPMDCSTPPPCPSPAPRVYSRHVRWVSDAIQPSHPRSSPSPPSTNPSQHQSLFQWVDSSHEVAKVLEFQQYMNRELPDVQAGFREGRGTRDQIANIRWIMEKAREFQKNIYSALLTMPKPLTVWITINCGKFWKRWEYQTTWPASWEICILVRKQQLELDMEQQTGSK